MTINRSNIKLQVTRGNKMKNLKSKKASDMQAEPSKTASELQAIPKGNKGKGLSKLPKPVRNKMGFKKQGGSLTDDIKKIKSKEANAPKSEKVGDINKRGTTKKPRDAFRKPLRKRKGGGMVYQLYGGSTKDFSDGNKFIQSLYD